LRLDLPLHNSVTGFLGFLGFLAGFTSDGLQARQIHVPSKAKKAISHFST
jgi:hypothetical protein